MIHEDIVTCEGCGAEIVHLICGNVTEDTNYRLCDSCREERDAESDEEHEYRASDPDVDCWYNR